MTTNVFLPNALTAAEMRELTDVPIVRQKQRALSVLRTKVEFTIPLSSALKAKLESTLNVQLGAELQMRWVKGDTPAHRDTGATAFERTCLVYLTDSPGNLVIDGESYPIRAGNAHIFSEGLEHATTLTGNSERLMVGPMSEQGQYVGVPFTGAIFFAATIDLESGLFPYFIYYTPGDSPIYNTVTIPNIPLPVPSSGDGYNIDYISNVAEELWNPPPGYRFAGWKYYALDGFSSLGGYDASHIYMPGETYSFSDILYLLIPNWVQESNPVLKTTMFAFPLNPLQRLQARNQVAANFVQKAWVKDSSQVTQRRALPKETTLQKFNGAAVADTKAARQRVRNSSCVPPKKKNAVR